MSTIIRTLTLAASVAVWASTEATAAEYQCRKLDSSLRIAIEVSKAGHTLPCEVVAEDDRGERAVLYSAQYDRDYCPTRIEKTKDELEQDGWICEQTSEVNVVRADGLAADPAGEEASVEETVPPSPSNAVQVVGGERTIAAGRQCRLGNELRRIHIEIENPASGKPCELIYWADGDRTKPGEVLWRAEHDAAFCPRRLERIVSKWSEDGWQCEVDDVQTAAVDTQRSSTPESEPQSEEPQPEETDGQPATPASNPTLEAVIAADAERIGEWMEVEPAIEIAARGDLNDDGADDAVVLLAYQSDQAAYRQYLMSYLVADDGYQLASVKLLTGVSPPPDQARVEQIDEGIIWLTLPGQDGSALGQTGYRLRDQQLVEIDADQTPSSN